MPETQKKREAELLKQVLPEDLNKFGMIPEFVGRIPVIRTLDELTREDLVHILTEPKNALVKQYKKMFEYENSTLVFEAEALNAIADEAVDRGHRRPRVAVNLRAHPAGRDVRAARAQRAHAGGRHGGQRHERNGRRLSRWKSPPGWTRRSSPR